MSHFSEDIAIDNVIDEVAEMEDMEVMKALNPANITKVSKFTGGEGFGANIIDFARAVLEEQKLEEWAEMPGPCG